MVSSVSFQLIHSRYPKLAMMVSVERSRVGDRARRGRCELVRVERDLRLHDAGGVGVVVRRRQAQQLVDEIAAKIEHHAIAGPAHAVLGDVGSRRRATGRRRRRRTAATTSDTGSGAGNCGRSESRATPAAGRRRRRSSCRRRRVRTPIGKAERNPADGSREPNPSSKEDPGRAYRATSRRGSEGGGRGGGGPRLRRESPQYSARQRGARCAGIARQRAAAPGASSIAW